MLADEQFDLAMNDFTRAIALVEQVMNTLSSADQWSTFLHQYTELYAQAAITQVRRNQDSQALSTLSSFVRITGRDPIMHYLMAYENSILATTDEMSENEAQTNTEAGKTFENITQELMKGVQGTKSLAGARGVPAHSFSSRRRRKKQL